ncbi:MAG: hypothetical protein BAJALOKI1v1_2390004 [Promethearchaeota archaeon]|nr:MAG: hypothetical protein BAJALOKI1v1_2390004 [Candidatus Lokiarchaeota archaeon]
MTTKNEGTPNNLIHEKSPYLLQHAYNPVKWYPWGDEAFSEAQKQNKPIFLSIGYSTCHWCHVMEKESFEDEDVAQLINETFIPIKVDREERPDIDKIYMTACQVMSGRGGWPLTILMTPDKKPFFAGTYIPKQARFGQSGLMTLIPRVREMWNTEKDKLIQSTEQVTYAIKNALDEAPGQKLDKNDLREAFIQLRTRFDPEKGGFGMAPKFPTPHNLLFLLRYWQRTTDATALKMVEKTLQEMRKGGIYDHIGFGFHRYSTDAEWFVPHFEKMLYDQALLAIAYLETFQATGNEFYAQVAQDIFTYVLRDMTSPEGGFYSAEDADSEGVEGKFYLWTHEEIKDLLDDKEYNEDMFAQIYNITSSGNYREEATKQETGKNILHLTESFEEIADKYGLSLSELKEKLEKMQKLLFLEREKRIHPQKDDKILVDWNGLMIAALAKGARVLKDDTLLTAAEKAFGFVSNNLIESNGTLLHRYRDGQADFNAFLDDYAFLIWASLELYESTFNVKYLDFALSLNEKLFTHFWDENIGAFYFTSDEGEDLIVRQKEIYDGAIPSGNSVAMLNLLKLGFYTGDLELERKAEIISQVFAEKIKNNPSTFCMLMCAVDFAMGPSYKVVITGNSKGDDTINLIEELQNKFYPNVLIIKKPTEVNDSKILTIAEFITEYTTLDEKATAYVCFNQGCKPPTTKKSQMIQYIDSKW